MKATRSFFDTKGTFKSTEGIEGVKAVYVNSGGKIELASADNLVCASSLIGVTEGTVFKNSKGKVVILGEVSDESWVWDLSKPVLLGINGELTQATPITGFIKVMGLPLTASLVLVRPETSIILV